MNLNRVTVTGADDNTNPQDLIALSREFPFVEWGILVSKRQEGSSRFPSRDWCLQFTRTVAEAVFGKPSHGPLISVSTHVCGVWVRQLLGDLHTPPFVWENLPICTTISDRIQINTHAEPHSLDLARALHALRQYPGKQYIFQIEGVNDHWLNIVQQQQGIDVAGLFDRSGGSGKVPGQWPNVNPGFPCGYAGGLGPDNLKEELGRIADAAGDSTIWIDMEFRVRTLDGKGGDVFDLTKVARCLEIARDYMQQKVAA